MRLVLLAGLALRVILLLLTDGNGDIENLARVGALFQDHPLGLYTRQQGAAPIWPYPPGYAPVVVLVERAASVTGLDFSRLVRLPVIAADLGIAWLVAAEFARQGRSSSESIIAAACIALSPVFVAVAGVHGQIDSVMMLFAVAGVVAWRWLPGPYDVVLAGVFFGIAISIKTVVAVIVIAFAFAARTLRRTALFVVSACIVPLIALLPYVLISETTVRNAMSYRGIPGVGGLSLVVQPELVDFWLLGLKPPVSDLQASLYRGVPKLVLLGVLITTLVALRKRPEPVLGAVLLLLAGYAVGVNFSLHYLIWVIPMIVLAGYWRLAVALQIALLLPVIAIYVPLANDTLATVDAPWPAWAVHGVYVPYMILLWVLGVVAWGLGVRTVRRHERLHNA